MNSLLHYWEDDFTGFDCKKKKRLSYSMWCLSAYILQVDI